MKASKDRERCDRCKKFVSAHCPLSTLEGIVSPENINFAICDRCFEQKSSSDREYWGKWASHQKRKTIGGT